MDKISLNSKSEILNSKQFLSNRHGHRLYGIATSIVNRHSLKMKNLLNSQHLTSDHTGIYAQQFFTKNHYSKGFSAWNLEFKKCNFSLLSTLHSLLSC